MKIGEVIYEEDKNGLIKKSKIQDFMGVEGVWALYGKDVETSKSICLNVGKSKNVGREILYDIGCLHFINSRDDGTRKYINQFGEDCCFKYESGQTQEYLYPIIASRYTLLKFVYVDNESNKEKEKEYAKKNHAIFWRNGGVYKESVTIN